MRRLAYNVVPKTRLENLQFRLKMLKLGFKSRKYRDCIMDACARDILLWVNTFGWIYESRTNVSSGKCLPFLTYEFQDKTILELVNVIKNSDKPEFDADRVILKSRDMGASWICIAVFTWFWIFEREVSLLMLSAKEEMVDKPGNPKSLFAKVLYLVKRLPAWMKPDYYKTAMHLENRENRSVIDGEATSGTTSVSDRRMAMLLDEFAKVDSAGKSANLASVMLRQTADVTNCRIFNSTPEGMDSGFAVVAASKTVIKMHWSEHPLKNQGLYRVEQGKIEVIDAKWHENNPGYKFRDEPGLYEGLRSPWYDREWDRRMGIKRDIAQELDMDFVGSGDPFFDGGKLAARKMENVTEPMRSSFEAFTGERFHDEDARNGRMRIWCPLDAAGMPPQNTTYTIGIDIGTGNGTSDSAISVGDDITKEKVAEFISNGMMPEDFARAAVAVAGKFETHLGKAFLIWDMAGPGIAFGQTITKKLGYGHVYYYRKTGGRENGKFSKTPGFPSNMEIKRGLMELYRASLYDGSFITRSELTYEECRQYIYDGTGRIVHTQERHGPGSAKGENHGDIAFSEALLVMGMLNRARPVRKKRTAPYGSLAWRREQWKKEQIKTMFAA